MPALIVSRLPAFADGDALEDGDVVVQPARLRPAVARAALPVRMNCRLRMMVSFALLKLCLLYMLSLLPLRERAAVP